MKFDTNFSLIKKISTEDLIKFKPYLYKLFPVTYSVHVESEYIRSWGGRRVSIKTNPFTYSLLGSDLKEMEFLYRDKIKLIREKHGLKENEFNENFFYSQNYLWITGIKNKKKLDNLRKLTLSRELGIFKKGEIEYLDNRTLIKLELKRLQKISCSLVLNGFTNKLNDFTPIRANLVTLGKRFFFLIRHGEHRIASLPYLKNTRLDIWIRSKDIINIDYSNHYMVDWFNTIYEGELINPPLTNIYGFFFI